MSTEPEPDETAPRRFRIDEDWAATVVGLLLVVLVLLKVIPEGLVP